MSMTLPEALVAVYATFPGVKLVASRTVGALVANDADHPLGLCRWCRNSSVLHDDIGPSHGDYCFEHP